jgi:hypothetical protein
MNRFGSSAEEAGGPFAAVLAAAAPPPPHGVAPAAEDFARGFSAATSAMTDVEATAWLQQFIHWEQFPPPPPNSSEDGCGFPGSDAAAMEADGPRQQQQQQPNHETTARESNSNTADIPTRIQWRRCLAESVGPAMGACADATLRRAALMHALLLELGPHGSGVRFDNNISNVLPDVPARPSSDGAEEDADATSSSMGHFESSAASNVSVWEYLLLLHSRRHSNSSSSSSSAVATSAEWDWLRGHSLQEWRREWEACNSADEFDEDEDDNHNNSSSLPTLGGRPRRHRVAWMHGWPDRLRLHYERLDELRTNSGVPNHADGNAHNAHPSTAAASSKRRRLDFLLDGSGTKNDPAEDAECVVDDRWIVALLYLICHWSVVVTTIPDERGDIHSKVLTTDTGTATTAVSSSSKRPFHDRPWEDAFDHIVVRLYANHCPEEFRAVRPGAGVGPPPSHHSSHGGGGGDGASAPWISDVRVISDWYLLDHWKCLRQIRQRHLDENHAPSWTVENWVRGRYGGNVGYDSCTPISVSLQQGPRRLPSHISTLSRGLRYISAGSIPWRAGWAGPPMLCRQWWWRN